MADHAEPIDRSRGALSGLAPIVVLIVLLALLPTLASLLGNPFLIKIGTRILVFALAAVALNLVLGFGGLVSLLHAGLFGIGGYVVGILAFHAEAGEPLLGVIPGSTDWRSCCRWRWVCRPWRPR